MCRQHAFQDDQKLTVILLHLMLIILIIAGSYLSCSPMLPCYYAAFDFRAERDSDVQVAYVPQSAFIYNASVRDNILFGLPFQQERYDQAIAAAAVRPDLDNMDGTGT